MIDAGRWVLAEAWLSLGLRLRWAPAYGDVDRDDWQEDSELRTRYIYDGAGVWLVREDTGRTSLGYTRPTSPQMGTDSMRHELSHYLSASAEDRAKRNFGLAMDDAAAEERALQAEEVIDAMLAACARITTMAIERKPR